MPGISIVFQAGNYMVLLCTLVPNWVIFLPGLDRLLATTEIIMRSISAHGWLSENLLLYQLLVLQRRSGAAKISDRMVLNCNARNYSVS